MCLMIREYEDSDHRRSSVTSMGLSFDGGTRLATSDSKPRQTVRASPVGVPVVVQAEAVIMYPI